MGAKVKNPRKKFLFGIAFPKHPFNVFLAQKVTMPDIEIEEVAHGDINRDVKTAGRVTIGTLTVEKLMTTSGRKPAEVYAKVGLTRSQIGRAHV